MSADRILQRVWYERSPLLLFLLLVPLSLVFSALAALRRTAYRVGLLRSFRLPLPVLIVGNISVGGTGKTPLVVWISHFLKSRNVSVGIITRGYGGAAGSWPQDVTGDSSATLVGDEAVMMASRTDAIVVAGPDRVAAAQRAIQRGAQIVISDDGLQHYRLQRDGEIAVIDGRRRFGNGWLLPAGPLRERLSRLDAVDLLISSQRDRIDQRLSHQELIANHALADAINLRTGEVRSIASFAGTSVNAIAGIGNPDAFFAMLRELRIDLNARPLADHQQLSGDDVCFGDDRPVLMTEKDAVKCRAFATQQHWAVRLEVNFNASDAEKLAALLMKLLAKSHDAITVGIGHDS